jgi:2-oxoisovalerate dehydrogenase E1 component alpha subunit
MWDGNMIKNIHSNRSPRFACSNNDRPLSYTAQLKFGSTLMSVAAQFSVEFIQCLRADGALSEIATPLAQDLPKLRDLFQRMLFLRCFDSKAIALQRTGKLGTYASALGHEAAHVGIGSALRPEDCFAPMYREYGAQFYRGVLPRHVLMYWGGDERGNNFSGAQHDFSWCVPISTQCLHAAGAAMAFKYRNEPRVALCVCGDGGTSKADFYGAINIAGAQKLPLVLVIVNNQYAISVPRVQQTGAKTLAQKGLASGLTCVQADGNDILAVRHVLDAAIAHARAGHGASVVELVTYRLGDHTTADDARRYRQDDEVKFAWTQEPMLRLRHYLSAQGVWSEAIENAWLAQCNEDIDSEVNAYLELAPPPVSAMFDYQFAELPHDLRAQRALYVAQ